LDIRDERRLVRETPEGLSGGSEGLSEGARNSRKATISKRSTISKGTSSSRAAISEEVANRAARGAAKRRAAKKIGSVRTVDGHA
jgi:hypothetical protein